MNVNKVLPYTSRSPSPWSPLLMPQTWRPSILKEEDGLHPCSCYVSLSITSPTTHHNMIYYKELIITTACPSSLWHQGDKSWNLYVNAKGVAKETENIFRGSAQDLSALQDCCYNSSSMSRRISWCSQTERRRPLIHDTHSDLTGNQDELQI